jgi:ABC-type oligopeptide transport system substrate-binding subunit
MSQTHIQAVSNGWIHDYLDPQDYVSLLFKCQSDYNIGEWCNQEFDRIASKADVQPSQSRRAQLYVQAQKVALNDGGVVMMDNAVRYSLKKPYVKGWQYYFALGGGGPPHNDWSKVRITR